MNFLLIAEVTSLQRCDRNNPQLLSFSALHLWPTFLSVQRVHWRKSQASSFDELWYCSVSGSYWFSCLISPSWLQGSSPLIADGHSSSQSSYWAALCQGLTPSPLTWYHWRGHLLMIFMPYLSALTPNPEKSSSKRVSPLHISLPSLCFLSCPWLLHALPLVLRYRSAIAWQLWEDLYVTLLTLQVFNAWNRLWSEGSGSDSSVPSSNRYYSWLLRYWPSPFWRTHPWQQAGSEGSSCTCDTLSHRFAILNGFVLTHALRQLDARHSTLIECCWSLAQDDGLAGCCFGISGCTWGKMKMIENGLTHSY